jgi:hypothetical protein
MGSRGRRAFLRFLMGLFDGFSLVAVRYVATTGVI